MVKSYDFVLLWFITVSLGHEILFVLLLLVYLWGLRIAFELVEKKRRWRCSISLGFRFKSFISFSFSNLYLRNYPAIIFAIFRVSEVFSCLWPFLILKNDCIFPLRVWPYCSCQFSLTYFPVIPFQSVVPFVDKLIYHFWLKSILT